jgi:hypothetical protein
MKYWNQHDVASAQRRFEGLPDRELGLLVLTRLMNWTNRNSDGWAYWPKPVRAAKRLMELLDSGDHWDPEDVTEAELKKAFTPIKSFLTRQGVDHGEVFPSPVPL